MATERVNLTMDRAALAAARATAQAEGQSLSEWLSRAAWDKSIEHAARISAEQDNMLTADLAAWDANRMDQMFVGAREGV